MKKSNPALAGPSPMADKDYQAEDDHRTMMRSTEIQSDPSRMSGVKRHQSKQEKKLALLKKNLTGRSITGGKR